MDDNVKAWCTTCEEEKTTSIERLTLVRPTGERDYVIHHCKDCNRRCRTPQYAPLHVMLFTAKRVLEYNPTVVTSRPDLGSVAYREIMEFMAGLEHVEEAIHKEILC